MKRFVTYLYEYERGIKARNAGFIRVDIRGSVVNIEINIRKLRIGDEKGTICGLFAQDGLRSLELGEMKLFSGQGDVSLQMSTKALQGTEVSIDDVVGIGIRFSNDCYVASCWVDEYAEAIARGDYQAWAKAAREAIPPEEEFHPDAIEEAEISHKKNEVRPMTEETEIAVAQVDDMQKTEQKWICPNSDEVQEHAEPQYSYRKLELTRMHELPMQDRHYSGNAFLIHGFWNYGYVVLKTEMEGDKKTTWLGVPGVYERPEAAMALAFGFPLFEAIPSEMATAPLNVERSFSQEEMRKRSFQQRETKGATKNQPVKEDLFGCWFVELHM